MADYKDIISGTINSIVGKVKEVAESGAVRDIYENGANRAKSYGRIAKLALELNGCLLYTSSCGATAYPAICR